MDKYLAGKLVPFTGPTALMHAGMGMGRGMGMFQPRAPMVSSPPAQPMSREEENLSLKDQLKSIEGEVSRIKSRLEQLKAVDK